jgi:hypothetical protein
MKKTLKKWLKRLLYFASFWMLLICLTISYLLYLGAHKYYYLSDQKGTFYVIECSEVFVVMGKEIPLNSLILIEPTWREKGFLFIAQEPIKESVIGQWAKFTHIYQQVLGEYKKLKAKKKEPQAPLLSDNQIPPIAQWQGEETGRGVDGIQVNVLDNPKVYQEPTLIQRKFNRFLEDYNDIPKYKKWLINEFRYEDTLEGLYEK